MNAVRKNELGEYLLGSRRTKHNRRTKGAFGRGKRKIAGNPPPRDR